MTTHFDPEMFGAAMGDLVRETVEPLERRIAELEREIADMKSDRAAEVERRLGRLEHKARSDAGRKQSNNRSTQHDA